MRYDRYVLCLANVDYLCSVGGVGRYMRDEIDLLQGHQISSMCFFPFRTKRNKRIDRHLSKYWGVRVDGILVGFYGIQEIFELIAELALAGKRPLEIQLHHLNYYILPCVAQLLWNVPIAVKLFLHDYYTICPRSHLLQNGKVFCGDAKPTSEKCSDCAFWTPQHHESIHDLLISVRDRLTVVAPSSAAQRVWLSTFPDFHAQIRILPHLKEVGQVENLYVPKMEGSPIRLAYVGAPVPYKGWGIFQKLAEDLSAHSLNYEFYHFGLCKNVPRFIRNIPVSNVEDGPDAMTQAIQRAGIDIVLLWALWPETYSYTLYESLMANVMLITNGVSGNITDLVGGLHVGRIFRDEGELLKYARDEKQVRNDIDAYRGNRKWLPARLVPNDAILDTIDGGGHSPLPTKACRIHSVWHMEFLYALKLLKQRISRD